MNTKSPFARWSMAAGLTGMFTMLFPYLTLPLGVLAILLGAISMKHREDRRSRAIAGIVLGCALVMLGAVLIYSMAALRPYEAQLSRLWLNTLRQLQ